VEVVKVTRAVEVEKAVERGLPKVVFKTGGRSHQVSPINQFEFDGASFLQGVDERGELDFEILPSRLIRKP
jgi:hypothetical protein